MDCLIISGMSGAGKTVTADIFEDMGYYCIDNMPTRLIPNFVQLFKANSTKYEKVAFVVDIRGDGDFIQLHQILENLEEIEGLRSTILFLDARDEMLLKRHKEKRRKHPLEGEAHSLTQAIAVEREVLDIIMQEADYVVDTSNITTAQLQSHLKGIFEEENKKDALIVTINSFGFKHGIPEDSDLVFDVRFLKNPHYVPELKKRTGLEEDVAAYVFSDEYADEFMEKLVDFTSFLIPRYIDEGKSVLVISIGCTGGRHRSVAISEKLGKLLANVSSNVTIRHRDMGKE